ncbi:MAG: LPS export ABC transporter periplasmic protein LptC [Nitrospinae bacterium]|nr:LPS export ABC transporter periplasmic protein LptC [Nitrospinota bacterium]
MKSIKGLRWFLIAVVLLVTLLTAFYLILNRPGNGGYTPIEMAKKGIDLIMRRVRLVEKKGGHKEWELLARKAEFDKSENKINLEDIKATFYPADRKPITISSKKGIVNNENKDINLIGDVLIKSDDGYKLNTENLLWIASKRVLETDDFVKITGERFKITGNGLISNIDSQDIKIKSRVEAVYN